MTRVTLPTHPEMNRLDSSTALTSILMWKAHPDSDRGAYFDGESSQVQIDPIDPGPFGELTNDFTVMAWINPEQFDHKGRIFGSSPAGGGWGFGTVGDALELTTYGVKDYDQPVPLELNTWTHAAVALDADNSAHFYVNGEFVGTQTHSAPGNTTDAPFFIGASCCDTEFFEGTVGRGSRVQRHAKRGPNQKRGDVGCDKL